MNKEEYNTYHRSYQLEKYHRRRQEAREYLGNKCAVCGIYADKLDFDHINPITKINTIAKMWCMSNEKFWNEVNKCQLLCIPHHKAKTSLEDKIRRPITHGKYWAAYKYHCKCEECEMYKEESARKRREARANQSNSTCL